MDTIHTNVSLLPYNTFGIDVQADFYIELKDASDIVEALPFDKKTLVLGGGSNVLFTEDFHGLLIRNCIGGISEEVHGDNVVLTAGAGVIWDELVNYCMERNYGGIENLISIPGSVGAAPIQNIGAYGVELKDCFHYLEAIELSSGEKKVFKKEDCHFGYRDSIFKSELKGTMIVLSVSLILKKNKKPDTSYGVISAELERMGVKEPSIRAVGVAVANIRSGKLPDPEELGNAGSFFKNPVVSEEIFNKIRNEKPDAPSYKEREGMVKVPAGWLIEQCGWKGRRMGNAGVHENQALVLVNHGGATGQEILALANAVKTSVNEKFGINLEKEVNVI